MFRSNLYGEKFLTLCHCFWTWPNLKVNFVNSMTHVKIYPRDACGCMFHPLVIEYSISVINKLGLYKMFANCVIYTNIYLSMTNHKTDQ